MHYEIPTWIIIVVLCSQFLKGHLRATKHHLYFILSKTKSWLLNKITWNMSLLCKTWYKCQGPLSLFTLKGQLLKKEQLPPDQDAALRKPELGKPSKRMRLHKNNMHLKQLKTMKNVEMKVFRNTSNKLIDNTPNSKTKVL